MSNLSVFWQVPQFVLIGISEILASITSLEFFYTQAPTAMRSVSQSLNLFTQAIGAWIVIPILFLVNCNPNNEWVPTDLDKGHLDYYFFLLASMMALTIMLFNYIAMGYEYKTQAELEIDDTPRSSFTGGRNANAGDDYDDNNDDNDDNNVGGGLIDERGDGGEGGGGGEDVKTERMVGVGVEGKYEEEGVVVRSESDTTSPLYN